LKEDRSCFDWFAQVGSALPADGVRPVTPANGNSPVQQASTSLSKNRSLPEITDEAAHR